MLFVPSFQSQSIEHIIQVPVPVPVPILSTNTTEFLELTSPDGRKLAIPLTITNASELLQQSVAIAPVKPEVNRSEVTMDTTVVVGTQSVTPAPISGVNSAISIGTKPIQTLPLTVIMPDGTKLPINNVHGTSLTNSGETHIVPATSLSQLLTTNATRDYAPVTMVSPMSSEPNQQSMVSTSIIAQAFSASNESLQTESILPQMPGSRISPSQEEGVAPSQEVGDSQPLEEGIPQPQEEGIPQPQEEGIPSAQQEQQDVVVNTAAHANEQRALTVNSNAIVEWLPFTTEIS